MIPYNYNHKIWPLKKPQDLIPNLCWPPTIYIFWVSQKTNSTMTRG